MTGSVEQLTQKLASLDKKTEDLKAKLDQTYGGYLKVLARVFQQQLLQACYHICTEGYPQEFVALSMTQRYDLQQRIKTIAQKTGTLISDLLVNPPPRPPSVQMPEFFSMSPDQFLSGEIDDSESDDTTQTFTIDLSDPSIIPDFSAGIAGSSRSTINGMWGEIEIDEVEDVELDDDEDDYEEDDEDYEEDEDDEDDGETTSETPEPGRRKITESDARELQAILSQVAAAITAKEPKTPVDQVLSWQNNLEHGIREQICLASYEVNQTLQSAHLIPPQVPDRALEAASRANGGDGATKISHVIQMLVEMANVGRSRESSPQESSSSNESSSELSQPSESGSFNDRSQNAEQRKSSNRVDQKRGQNINMPSIPKLTHVIALQVRLAEIEFQDPLLMRWRRNIRELTQEVQSLTREYRKYQRKRSVAEAQVAWRSTWLSDR